MEIASLIDKTVANKVFAKCRPSAIQGLVDSFHVW